MNLLRMSFLSGISILVIVLIRVLFLYKLPKRLFPILWGIVLCRLLIPFKICSRFSVYSIVHALASKIRQINLVSNEFSVIQNNSAHAKSVILSTEAPFHEAFYFRIIWLIGLLLCVLFFLVTHLRSRREYKTALPVDNLYIKMWIQEHSIWRDLKLRQSDRIFTPLTYGIIQPVILLPKQTDWEDKNKLHYILAHELIHVRRFDTLTKLIMAAALCVHWFNPLVWLMYLLASQDIELSCDESVVRTFGGNTKLDYAMTLIGLEEEKNYFMPLVNNFSKNAIEERIISIMKMKKTSRITILITVLIVIGVTIIFATSAVDKKDTASGKKDNHSSYRDEDYTELMSLKTTQYRQLKVSEFDSQVERVQTLYTGYNPNDENVDFMQTLLYATTELGAAINNDVPILSVGTGSNKKTDNDGYYGAELSYDICWNISNKEEVTVGERDDTLNACQNSIQSILESKSRDELRNKLFPTQLQLEFDTLAKEHTNDYMSVQIVVSHFKPTEME